MIDPKQVQLTPYQDNPHLWRPVAFTPDDAKMAVMDLLEEVDNRFQLFVDAGVTTIGEYNVQTSDKLPFIILLGTEIADLMMIDSSSMAAP